MKINSLLPILVSNIPITIRIFLYGSPDMLDIIDLSEDLSDYEPYIKRQQLKLTVLKQLNHKVTALHFQHYNEVHESAQFVDVQLGRGVKWPV